MAPEIQIEQPDQNSNNTFGTEPQQGAVNIQQRIDDLEIRANNVINDFQKLEKDIKDFKTLVYFIIGAMAVAFAFTSILIGLDYFKYNNDRYEKIINKTEEINKSFYSKEELNPIIEKNNKNDNILNCLKNSEYFKLKCFN
jgi:hypothetical protein